MCQFTFGISEMNPNIWQQFLALLDGFHKMKNGIYLVSVSLVAPEDTEIQKRTQ